MSGHESASAPRHGSPPAERGSIPQPDETMAELGYELRPAPRIVDMAPWLIVGCGVGAMIFLFVTATSGVPATRPGDVGNRPGFSPAWPFGPGAGRSSVADEAISSGPPQSAPTAPAASATGVPGPTVTPARRAPVATKPAPTQPRPAPPPAAEVTGRYRVMAGYHDSFIGEVLVVNDGQNGRQWTVELRFPDNVGRLRTAWVESAPQATLRRSGDWYVFTSTAPVAARSSVPLRFHFDRSGRGETPTECRTNGSRCTIA